MSGSKAPLACTWHEERFYTAGPVPRNGAEFLADGKPWVSMPLIQYGFTIPIHLTFLVCGFSTNVFLMLLTNWPLALYARKHNLYHGKSQVYV